MYETILKAQFAIRPGVDPSGCVHVQVSASPSTFHNGYQRKYGGAFEVKNSALLKAVESQTPTLPSKAGTSRKYVGGTIQFHDGDGATLTLTAKAVQPTMRVLARKADEVVSIHIEDSDLR